MNAHLRTLTALDPERGASNQLTEADEQLLATIIHQPVPDSAHAPRRRSVRRIAIVGVATAAIVGAGLTQIDIGGQPIGSAPAAAAVLERAAEAALDETTLVVGPGQFLKLTQIEDHWGDPTTDSAGRTVAPHWRWTRQIWIPFETQNDWIFDERTTPVQNISKDDRMFNQPEVPELYTRPSWAVKSTDGGYIPTYDPAWYASLPREPEALMTALKDDIGAGDDLSSESLFMETFSEVLRSPLAPADIRAILFEELADSADMDVVDGVADLDGRKGVALHHKGSTWQMLFDAKTGEYLGDRATTPDYPDAAGSDAAKTTFLTTSRAEVVDSAPTVD